MSFSIRYVLSHDAKKDELWNYTENARVMELLPQSLVQLYEGRAREVRAITYLKKR